MIFYEIAALIFSLACNVIIGLLFVRMVLSWLTLLGNETIQRLYEPLSAITEPLLLPARAILRRIPGMDNLPLDLAPLITILLLSILNIVLFGG